MTDLIEERVVYEVWVDSTVFDQGWHPWSCSYDSRDEAVTDLEHLKVMYPHKSFRIAKSTKRLEWSDA